MHGRYVAMVELADAPVFAVVTSAQERTDKNMKKKLLIITPIVIILVLFFPVRLQYKDGGTIEYRALIYSVKNRHSLRENIEGTQGYLPEIEEGAVGYIAGLEIRVFGIEIMPRD